MIKKSLLLGAFITTLLLGASVASAHSTVSPSQTATQKYETFTLSVPTEREVPTVAVRLIIPEGLDRVTPFVKPGWRIRISENSEGKVTQIDWTGGSIPDGQKDVFQFTARTPATSTTLVWKAHQTYQGGEIVAWDQDPSPEHTDDQSHAEGVSNPWSETEVNLSGSTQTTNSRETLPMIFSVLAVLLSLAAIVMIMQRNTHVH